MWWRGGGRDGRDGDGGWFMKQGAVGGDLWSHKVLFRLREKQRSGICRKHVLYRGLYIRAICSEKSISFGSEMHSDVRDLAIRLDNDAIAAPSDRPCPGLLGESPLLASRRQTAQITCS